MAVLDGCVTPANPHWWRHEGFGPLNRAVSVYAMNVSIPCLRIRRTRVYSYLGLRLQHKAVILMAPKRSRQQARLKTRCWPGGRLQTVPRNGNIKSLNGMLARCALSFRVRSEHPDSTAVGSLFIFLTGKPLDCSGTHTSPFHATSSGDDGTRTLGKYHKRRSRRARLARADLRTRSMASLFLCIESPHRPFVTSFTAPCREIAHLHASTQVALLPICPGEARA